MAKNFKILREQMSEERRGRVAAQAAEISRQIQLDEIRRAVSLTQEQLAATLGVSQTAVSKIEHQTDMYLSTLRRFIVAMGGELHLSARFADREYVLDHLGVESGVTPVESPRING